jgi:hypothetical protein
MICSASALSAETGGTGFSNPVAPGSGPSALSLFGRLGGTEFPKPVAPFWLLYATCPCNKILLASVELENLCYVCLDMC